MLWDRDLRTKTDYDRGRPPNAVCRFDRFKENQFISKNAKKLRNTGIFINGDFSKGTRKLRKKLW